MVTPREFFLAQKEKRESQFLKFDAEDGSTVEVEVRPPSRKGRQQILLEAAKHFKDTFKRGLIDVKPEGKQPTEEEIEKAVMDLFSDPANMLAYQAVQHDVAALYCTFIPHTNTRVFAKESLLALQELPCGGPFEKLADVAGGFINVRTEQAEKNSETTPNASK